MKIKTFTPEDLYEQGEDFEVILETGEGQISLSIGRGEPEDMCLARDLIGVFSIPEMLKRAYNAGKNGEELEEEILNEEE